MHKLPENTYQLLASRMTHDLAGVMGSINNGLELIDMINPDDSQEKQLINDSVATSLRKLKLFRAAFGPVGTTRMGAEEAISNWNADNKLKVINMPTMTQPEQVQVSILALTCLQTSCYKGGAVTIDTETGLTFSVDAPLVKIDPNLWGQLTQTGQITEVENKTIHFPILGHILNGRNAEFEHSQSHITLRLML